MSAGWSFIDSATSTAVTTTAGQLRVKTKAPFARVVVTMEDASGTGDSTIDSRVVASYVLRGKAFRDR